MGMLINGWAGSGGDDPNLLIKGRDPQMEKVVDEVMKLLKIAPKKQTPVPAMEDRTAKGLNKKE